MLLPSVRDVGGAVDVAQWHALLRAASGYHAFRRVYPVGDDAGPGRGLPAAQPQFSPFAGALRQPGGDLSQPAQLRLRLARRAYAAQERLDELRAALADQTIEMMLQRGLHEFMDYVQMQLTFVHNEVAAAFWRPI